MSMPREPNTRPNSPKALLFQTEYIERHAGFVRLTGFFETISKIFSCNYGVTGNISDFVSLRFNIPPQLAAGMIYLGEK